MPPAPASRPHPAPPSVREMDPLSKSSHHVDVALVGGGVTSTSTLLQLLAEHRGGRTGAATLRVALIDRDGDFCGGLPYGSRSGSASLTVTTLDEFVPDPLREDFLRWLGDHRERILDGDPELPVSRSWVEEHAEEIRGDRWASLFVPRLFFGRFLRDATDEAVARAEGVEVLFVQGEARALDRVEGDGMVVHVRAADDEIEIAARTVLLGVGSPPKQSLARTLRADGVGHCVEDTHARGMDATLAEIREQLRGLPPMASRRILVIGANADALELLHAGYRAGVGAALEHQIHILATDGRPDAWAVHPDRSAEYRSEHLRRYSMETPDDRLRAAALHAALAQDVEHAVGAGFSIQDTVAEHKALTGELLDRLPADEEKQFVDLYGTLCNRYFRPTGGDYQRVAAGLVERERIGHLAGRYEHATQTAAGWRVVVRTPQGASELADAYGVIVNCTGFEDLDRTQDPFLRSLQDEGVVEPTDSRRGIRVDERFRAAPRVFVGGPLLAGNLNGRLRIWHLESCRRIFAMAADVAAEIAAELRESAAATGAVSPVG